MKVKFCERYFVVDKENDQEEEKSSARGTQKQSKSPIKAGVANGTIKKENSIPQKSSEGK